jgi:squalene synthase HpnC
MTQHVFSHRNIMGKMEHKDLINTAMLCLMYDLQAEPDGGEWRVEESYDFCKKLTYSHYENFPVGSLLVPRELRRHVHAVYAFSRVADDFSDEDQFEGERMKYLENWEAQLKRCYEGHASNPVFIALAETAEEFNLPMELFQALLHAFKRDVTVKRYENFASLLDDYCRYSANPVGRLILLLFDYDDDELFMQSDCICTALQLTNFWQDIAIDLKKDRIYIPLEEMQAQGYREEELFQHLYDERFVRVMEPLVERTWQLFDMGYPLIENVQGLFAKELAFTWMGGTKILERTKKVRYNVFANRPKLSTIDFFTLGFHSLMGIRARREKLRKYFQQSE